VWIVSEVHYDALITDPGLSARVKALACTAPLHDLDERKASIQTADYTAYQMAELALTAIDLVTLSMDFDRGARPADVLASLATAVRAQAPDRDRAEHDAVASWVVNNLLNVGTADRGFRAVYGVTSPGGYDRRSFDFKLLEETYGPDGELYLRASNEAVNVLVGALDVDIESAQIAADLRLDVLIKRGRLSDAQSAAKAALYQTVRYTEMLREKLEATSRDVRNVDWLTAMPQFLDDALTHIIERYTVENAILINITEARDTADTPDRKQRAAELVLTITDCLRRHATLQSVVQSAGARFRSEQDRQTFTRAPAATGAFDLHGQLLTPALTFPVGTVDAPLATYFRHSVGLDVPLVVRLADLFDALITPPTERDMLGAEITDPDLDEITEPPRFSDATYDALGHLLALDPDTPQRLSGMLEAARKAEAADDSGEVADLTLLVVVRVLALAAQEIGTARRGGDRYVIVAIDDGSPLDDPEFAGADLIIARAEISTTGTALDPAGETSGDTKTGPETTVSPGIAPAAAGVGTQIEGAA
jgi:hypothetical protein